MSVQKHIRELVLTEAGYRCAVPTCRSILAIDLHHIVEVSQDGSDTPENLLALCPTCHALYHRGTITRGSIQKWKQDLLSVSSQDFRSKIEDDVRTAILSAEPWNEDRRHGFSHAASEFLARTCEVGFLDGSRFIRTGYACYIGDGKLITAGEVIDFLQEILLYRPGKPSLLTRVGLADFVVAKRLDWGSVTFLDAAPVDTAYWRKITGGSGDDMLPLQTDVKTRRNPYIGEQVGFLNSPHCTDDGRGFALFQFETAHVSFFHRTEALTLHNYVLTPVVSRIQYRGAPVFSEQGELLGVLRDSMKSEDEASCRPIAANFIGVKEFRECEGEHPDPLDGPASRRHK
ncbi:MAG: HNH endonuclease [Pseudomonadota bacterium]